MEETRRRNEASMARKRVNPLVTAASIAEAPPSPSSTGATVQWTHYLRNYVLLRQARDQRDRRRRARLKDRHQVRVASGQKIPDLADLTKSDADDMDTGLLSPDGNGGEPIGTIPEHEVSESEDVADRAANMLQGLRGDGDGDDSVPG
jgi:cytokinesis protein